jgi:hypothetical protein
VLETKLSEPRSARSPVHIDTQPQFPSLPERLQIPHIRHLGSARSNSKLTLDTQQMAYKAPNRILSNAAPPTTLRCAENPNVRVARFRLVRDRFSAGKGRRGQNNSSRVPMAQYTRAFVRGDYDWVWES